MSRLLAEARSGTVGTQTLVALAAAAGSGVAVAAFWVAKRIGLRALGRLGGA